MEGAEIILASDGEAKRGVMLGYARVHGASRCAQYRQARSYAGRKYGDMW
jgi:hypothetical protein